MGSGYSQLINWNREDPSQSPPGWVPVSDPLDAAEIRVLGALMEKEITTPDYYPLSLNALVNACNQKSNRNPVVGFTEQEVEAVLQKLKDRGLVTRVTSRDQRVPKFRQQFARRLDLSPPQTAILCVLMLRGALTSGEIRGCTGRLHEFGDLTEVEETLDELAGRRESALIARLARQPGQKESRVVHCLAGPPVAGETEPDRPPPSTSSATRTAAPPAGEDRLAALEEEVTRLRDELDGLARQFAEFRRQFE